MRKQYYCHFFLFIFTILITGISHAQQGVSINITGAPANSSATLDITSTTKGVLIPGITNASLSLINNPATGLMIYQTDIDSGFYYFTGARWIQLAAVDTSTKSAWLLGGNFNTNPQTHFIGTSDFEPLLFRINNVPAGSISHSSENVSLGKYTIGYNKGSQNTGMGSYALTLNSFYRRSDALKKN